MAEDSATEIRRLMDKASENILKPMREPIREIYIDSDFLYDYRLGALLLKLKTNDEYQYVLKHLQEYEEGPSPKITSYFPDLKITEEDLDLLESDPVYEKILHVAAPSTKLLMDLSNIILRTNTFNSNKDNPEPLTVWINQRNHIMPQEVQNRLVGFLKAADPRVHIKFLNYRTWRHVDPKLFSRVKVFFVYSMIDFCKLGSVAVGFMRKKKTLDKIIVANFMVEDDIKKEDELRSAVNKFIAVMMSMFDSFRFIKKSVLIER